TPTRGRLCRPGTATSPTGWPSRRTTAPSPTPTAPPSATAWPPWPPSACGGTPAPPGRVERTVLWGGCGEREAGAVVDYTVAGVEGGLCPPRGFRASAVDAGLVPGPGPDLGL